jgi:uncharacterized protein (TIGR03546 family)
MGMLAKLLKALNSDSSPWQLAFGFTLGMLMGITPLLGLHSLILLFVVLFFRVNISSFMVAWALFALIAVPLAVPMANLGESLLSQDNLQGVWRGLYSSAIGQLSQFYHTLTLGSLIVGLVFSPILLFLSKYLVLQYREKVMSWVNKLKLVQFLKGSRFYRLYEAVGE